MIFFSQPRKVVSANLAEEVSFGWASVWPSGLNLPRHGTGSKLAGWIEPSRGVAVFVQLGLVDYRGSLGRTRFRRVAIKPVSTGIAMAAPVVHNLTNCFRVLISDWETASLMKPRNSSLLLFITPSRRTISVVVAACRLCSSSVANRSPVVDSYVSLRSMSAFPFQSPKTLKECSNLKPQFPQMTKTTGVDPWSSSPPSPVKRAIA